MDIIKPARCRIGDTIIYDIFPSSENQLVAIGPHIADAIPTIIALDRQSGAKSRPSSVIIDPHRHTLILVFDFEQPIFTPGGNGHTIVLFDGKNTTPLRLNSLSPRPHPISMATLTIEEPVVILQWIDYHRRNLGIEQYYIYSNTLEHFERFSAAAAASPFADIITCVLWDFPYRFPGDSISGQTTQQNHAIYRFRHDRLIGLFDVDEFIVSKCRNLVAIMQEMVDDACILQRENIIKLQVAAISLQCLLFGCGGRDRRDPAHFLRDMTRCAERPEKKWERQKCFVVPDAVTVFSVHMVVGGATTLCLSPEIARFNHYFMLGKPDVDCDCARHCAVENHEIFEYL